MEERIPRVSITNRAKGDSCADSLAVFSAAGHADPSRWLSRVVVLVFGAVLIAHLWFPVRRAAREVEFSYNEGWNAYKQAMVANGTPLYGLPPGAFTGGTSYPPLSFHLVSWIAR